MEIIKNWMADDDQVRVEVRTIAHYGDTPRLRCAVTRRHDRMFWQVWQAIGKDEEHQAAERRTLDAALLCAASLFGLDPKRVAR